MAGTEEIIYYLLPYSRGSKMDHLLKDLQSKYLTDLENESSFLTRDGDSYLKKHALQVSITEDQSEQLGYFLGPVQVPEFIDMIISNKIWRITNMFTFGKWHEL